MAVETRVNYLYHRMMENVPKGISKRAIATYLRVTFEDVNRLELNYNDRGKPLEKEHLDRMDAAINAAISRNKVAH